MRAVLDVNVLVSALLSRDGAPARILAEWIKGGFDLIVSPKLLAELERVLEYPKIRKRVEAEDARELIELLALWAIVADDPDASSVHHTDPKDDYLIALARAEGAILVTGDRRLLDLGEKLPIHPPRAFLDELERGSS